MDNTTRVRTMGLLTIAGGLLWVMAFLVQDQVKFTPESGPVYIMAQLLFPIALMGTVAAALGLIWGGAVRGSRFGQIAVGLFLVGQILIIAGSVIGTFTGGGGDSPLIGIGALLSNVGGLLTGIAEVTAARWHGWQRFAPLVMGGYSFFLTFLPALVAQQEPSMVAITLWGFTWVIVGLALVTRASEIEHRSISAQAGGLASETE